MDRRALHKQFLQQFPIERLGSMTLEEYTNLNREDSFCYWLEVKTQDLGSIWGGSSYKFGIYRYEKRPDNPTVVVSDDEYAWYKKYNASNKEEAFNVVLKAIIGIVESAQKGDFQAIEEDGTFGNVVKWKIAFLYANETLLPFYKRDMLETLASEFGYSNPSKAKIYELQHFLMTQKGDKDLYDFHDELLDIIKMEQSNENKKYWMYAPGRKASKWERCQEQNIICIGWDALGDLSQFNSLEDCRNELKDRYNSPDSPFMNDGLAVWEFSHVMQPGDVVYAKQGANTIIARGIVKSEYRFDSSQEDYRHTRGVEWTHIGKWELKNIVLKTLTDITKYPDYVKKIEAMIVEGKIITEMEESSMYDKRYEPYVELLLKNRNLILNGAPGTGKTYLAKQVAAQIIFEGDVPEDFENNENFNNQCGFVQFHPSYDYTDFVEGLRPTRPNQDGNIGFERKDGIFKAFCKRVTGGCKYKSTRNADKWDNTYIGKYIEPGIEIPSSKEKTMYQITNVDDKKIHIEGESIKPKDIPIAEVKEAYEKKLWDGGQRNGLDSYTAAIAKHIYNSVVKDRIADSHINKVFIFIIDEINRGEISKIFGELFFSIDPGYRGKKGKVQTQYQNLIGDDDPFKEGFYIPENVYIIGTMNDIDRSVECMDFAMRRRFTFKEITAAESAENMGLSDEAKARMNSLNDAVSKIDGFNSSFHIGAAYFKDEGDFDALWELKLQGLLKEYLRGMPDAEESLETLKNAYELNSQNDND